MPTRVERADVAALVETTAVYWVPATTGTPPVVAIAPEQVLTPMLPLAADVMATDDAP